MKIDPRVHLVVSKKYHWTYRVTPAQFTGAAAKRVCVDRGETLQVWLFAGKVYETKDHDLTAEDVRALINASHDRRRLELQKAHALEAMVSDLTSASKRKPIPREVRVSVWQRDRGRCSECGANENLEFDHVIPLAMRGSNTARNLQLLCEGCNRGKGASLG